MINAIVNIKQYRNYMCLHPFGTSLSMWFLSDQWKGRMYSDVIRLKMYNSFYIKDYGE